MRQEMTWRPQDRIKLSSYVRKFNTSITKLSNLHPELADAGLLPSKLNVQAIIKSEPTRKDFNNILRSIDRWFKPKARDIITKGGIKMTRWDYNEVRYANQRVLYQKNKRLAQSTLNLRNRSARENKVETVSQKLAEMERRLNDQSRNNNVDLEQTYQAWNMFRQRMFKQGTEAYQEEKAALYYFNYNKAIYENFNDDHAREMSWLLEDFGLTGQQLYEIIGEYPELDFEWFYSPEEEEQKFEYWMDLFPKVAQKYVTGEADWRLVK